MNITGGLNASGNIVCTADSCKFISGDGDDLRLFHDGSNNYLRGYTAGQALYIDSLQDIRLRAGDNAGSYQNSIYMDNNGGVHCYYENSKKMETYSGGCIFQGNIKVNSLSPGFVDTKLTRKKLNPDWDSSLTYIPREERKEWDVVGLVGKLRMHKGQPTNPNWRKMRDISDAVEEWLVR